MSDGISDCENGYYDKRKRSRVQKPVSKPTKSMMKLKKIRDKDIPLWIGNIQKFVKENSEQYTFEDGYLLGYYSNNIQELIRYLKENRDPKDKIPYYETMLEFCVTIENKISFTKFLWDTWAC